MAYGSSSGGGKGAMHDCPKKADVKLPDKALSPLSGDKFASKKPAEPKTGPKK